MSRQLCYSLPPRAAAGFDESDATKTRRRPTQQNAGIGLDRIGRRRRWWSEQRWLLPCHPPTGACLSTQAAARRMGGRHGLSSHVSVSALTIVDRPSFIAQQGRLPIEKGYNGGLACCPAACTAAPQVLGNAQTGITSHVPPKHGAASPPRSTRLPRVVSPHPWQAWPTLLPCALRALFALLGPPAPHAVLRFLIGLTGTRARNTDLCASCALVCSGPSRQVSV